MQDAGPPAEDKPSDSFGSLDGMVHAWTAVRIKGNKDVDPPVDVQPWGETVDLTLPNTLPNAFEKHGSHSKSTPTTCPGGLLDGTGVGGWF